MNKLFIVGNLTAKPELRTTQDGTKVCTFSVAVNRRRKAQNGREEADFFRVTAWRALGENCFNYLDKGRKVAVTGAVMLNSYKGSDGNMRYNMELTADDVEFLTPKNEQQSEPNTANAIKSNNSGFVEVDGEELPF